MRRNVVKIIVSICCFYLTGCVTNPFNIPASSTQPTSTTPTQSWQTREAQLQKITSWDIRGSMGIKQAQQNQIVNVGWQQQGSNYHITLSGPLSLGRVTIDGSPQQVALRKSTEQVYTAKNPETLIAEQTGLRIPISNLYYWVRGIPAPGTHKATFDSANRITSLSQNGWQVNYLSYQNVQGIDLPRLIQFSQGDTAVRLAITRW